VLSQLPILPVLVPLLAAPACLLIRRPRSAWLFATAVAAVTFALTVQLFLRVAEDGVLSYALGGWPPPWGIEYRIDSLNALVLLVVTAIAAVVLLGAHGSICREVPADRIGLFYVAFLLCLAGLLGILATGDAFNLFVFLEISSLSTYAMVALGRDRRALVSAFNYLVMGTIGVTFILIGIGFLYMLTGTLNMLDLAQRLPGVGRSYTEFSAYAFIVVGVCLKLALFPLHFWLPGAYTYAPSIVTAFLAATSTKVAVYVLVRFSFTVFRVEFSIMALSLQSLLMTLGLLAIVVGSLVAIYEADIKRAIAYSSVAQIGYLVVGIGLGTVAGLQASLIHLFNHALMKGALFLALTAFIYRLGSSRVKHLANVGHRMPLTTAAFTIAGLSLIGMPGTAGFVSKWYLVMAAIDSGQWWVAALVVMGSLLSIVYIWRVVEIAYFPTLEGGAGSTIDATASGPEAPRLLLCALWILALGNLYFGLFADLPVDTAGRAAATVMEADMP